MEMLLTGDPIDAATALDWGLVNRVVPPAELDAAVKAFTDRIVARSAVGDRARQARVLRAGRPPARRRVRRCTTEAMACNLLGPDAAEGMDAFVEKRAAKLADADRGCTADTRLPSGASHPG